MNFKSIAGTLLLLAGLFSAPSLLAQKKTHSIRNQANTPEEEMAGFTVSEGFIVELVASEREGVINPIDLTFDDSGRLWTQTAQMYPLDPIADIQWDDLLNLMNDQQAQKNHPSFKRILDLYQGKTKGIDKILILSSFYNKAPVKTTVWADSLTIPQSIMPYKDGAYVAQGSELFFLKDTNQDGKADQRIPMLTGFGFTDTHTMSHSLVRAPGNWIHFSHGALNKGEVTSLQSKVKLSVDYSKIVRFSLDAKQLEIVSSGLNNIWGFQLRRNGQWYGSEANDLGYAVTPMEPGTGFPGIGNVRLRSYQPWMPELHSFRVGGTGISGTAFPDDESGTFPAVWKNVAFLANPITNTINAVKIIRNADGSVKMEHLPDLLTSKDDWFRPVNIEFGPDGCLYIADWYNKIISHNELPTTHPDRDKSHGRIWRIRHISQKSRDIPNFLTVKTEDLVNFLKSPSLWAKRAAWHQISDRPMSETKALASSLIALASDGSADEVTRIHALWSLEGIKHYDAKLLSFLLKSPLDYLRCEAVRSLTSFSLTPATLPAEIKVLIEDKNPIVRAQVLRTLTEMQKSDAAVLDLLVRACKAELPGNAMGGAYERKFERFLARRALEQYPDELQAYLNSKTASNVPVENLLWAIQALPKGPKETAFLRLWPKSNITKLDESLFIGIANMLDNKEIYEAVKPTFQNPAHAAAYTKMAVENQAQVQSPAFSALLQVPVSHLLANGTEPEINLALDAIGRFNIEKSSERITALINDQISDKTLELALKALENDLPANQQVFTQVFQNEKYSFDMRLAALHNLIQANAQQGSQTIQLWIPKLSQAEKKSAASALSASKQGAGLLMNLYDKKYIDLAAFDLSTAERIHTSNRSDRRSIALFEAVKKREEEQKAVFTAKFAKYMTIAEKKAGNATQGKMLFQTCLQCHKVGNTGQDIAPALDGSANRENEALLTALLDPDAAVESNYAVYRVSKKDGSSVEGYLVKKDDKGVTIALMGGSKVFIEAATIRSQGFLGGRSFMMKGLLDGYTDEQVADLLSYIRTLK
ncbi:c-type cytochrome [Rhodocytophaga rosea]|uniref:C-type cytochrome n=1 Tax=Rhodocytophaga rosea TaxID=2704465 RepID=A0A6C0GHI3_9BACT|nr:PVC-type heme-binding CxxCH protein [Rhodocytophaga rosea]QHT67274.1 c-type cytochrome [Rhodocytophaga rosea]